MRLWPAIFVLPLVFLALLTAAYALVPWACETQQHLPLHAISAVSLAVGLGGVFLAWRDWRAAGVEPPDDGGDKIVETRFLAVMGLMLSALVSLTIAALWFTHFMVPPCVR
jgi:hypothetical protein